MIFMARSNRDEALKKSEEKYRTLFDNIDQGFCVIEVVFDSAGRSIDYRFLETNPAFERHTGLRNPVGKSMRELAPHHEEYWFQLYGRVAQTGEPVSFENAARALDRFYEVYAYRVGRAEARTVGILFKDITQRKRQEDLLRDLDRRKDEFIATLAHELRNPLAPIRHSVDVLQHPDVDLEKTRAVARTMERQVSHLVRLVDDLLYVSRISSGKLELRLEPVELVQALRDAVEMSGPRLNAGNHEITFELPALPIILTADRVRLTQVIANLLNNAANYSDEGRPIRINVKREVNEAVIRVKDEGIGIAQEMLPRIFDMFMQAHTSDERCRGGLGIGLTLVKSLIELHGGRVTAQSEGPGKGSEFCVRLPLHNTLVQCEPPETVNAVNTAAHRRVLIADDNTDAADSLRMLLEMDGHEVRTANDGIHALETAESFRPNIALLDLGMPGLNGYEVARRMNLNPQLRPVTLAALTGWGQADDRRLTAEAGFKHHLTKPIDLGELRRILQEAPPAD